MLPCRHEWGWRLVWRGLVAQGKGFSMTTKTAAGSGFDADVAIVGGGPVGTFLAILLGRQGKRVTLIANNDGARVVARQLMAALFDAVLDELLATSENGGHVYVGERFGVGVRFFFLSFFLLPLILLLFFLFLFLLPLSSSPFSLLSHGRRRKKKNRQSKKKRPFRPSRVRSLIDDEAR